MREGRRDFLKKTFAAGSIAALSGNSSYADMLIAENLSGAEATPSTPAVKRADTEWFKNCKWGVFCHYLGAERDSQGSSSDNWNRQVDSFGTEKLASELEYAGAKYFFITIGQNSGHYCAPNETYDSLVGIKPSKCSKRDLISDIHSSLSKKGINLLVYLPSGAPAAEPVAMKKLKWEWGFEGEWGKSNSTVRTGKRLAEFQRMWESIIKDWSLRWGKKIKGWWIDGCYFPDEMYRHQDEPNFKSFAAALKAGNSESIVAFNPGVLTPVISMTEYEDFTAGEISDAFPVCPGRFINGTQYHILSYLGEWWGNGKPRFNDDFVLGYTKDVVTKGGIVTWDVPLGKTGDIPKSFLDQLKILNKI